MSDIDFQNGFIVGMATRGLTKGIPAIRIISAENGYNGEQFTWILVETNVEIGPVVSSENIEAFRVIGYKDWSLRIYTVYEVVKVNANTIGLRTANFEEVDMLLEVHYMQSTGTLKTSDGLQVNDLAGTFLVTFINAKIKIRVLIPFVDISTVSGLTVSSDVILLTDVTPYGIENIDFTDVSTVGTVTTSHTISVL